MHQNLFIIVVFLQSGYLCEENLNENVHNFKNFINDKTSSLKRLIDEHNFNKEMVKSIGKDEDAVNSYEDITILDDDGQLKNLKFKSARLKIPVELNNLINHSDKVSDNESGQNSDKDYTQQSKFFDELGCKLLFLLYFL